MLLWSARTPRQYASLNTSFEHSVSWLYPRVFCMSAFPNSCQHCQRAVRFVQYFVEHSQTSHLYIVSIPKRPLYFPQLLCFNCQCPRVFCLFFRFLLHVSIPKRPLYFQLLRCFSCQCPRVFFFSTLGAVW